MKRLISILLLISAFWVTIESTSCFFNAKDVIVNNFSSKKYDFTLNGNGGSFSNADVTVYQGKTTLPTPGRRGYTFAGFSNSANGNVEFSTDISDIDEINNKEIFAKWNVITYSLTYNLNGGSISGQLTTYNVEDTFTLPTPTKTGYSFSGWTGTGLSSKTKTVVISNAIGDRTYSANWDLVYYSLTYDLDGGSISGQPTSYNIEDGFSLPTPTKRGYEFTGWTGSGITTPTKNVSLSGVTGDRSYKANWKIVNYSISYNLNSGSISGQPTSYTINDTVSIPNPTRSSYVFTGWTGTDISTPTKNLTISSGSVGDRSYTANWKKNTYTVDVNSVVQNVTYSSGLDTFKFSVYIDNEIVADGVTDYYNNAVESGSILRIVVWSRDGYSITSFTDKSWTVTSDLTINPTWYDDIAPTITSFSVTNLGYYNGYNASAGNNVYVSVNAYDNGTGIQKYQTWVKPYLNGSGSGRNDGQSRTYTNILYISSESGRTFCAYAIDWAGNEAERCFTLKV